MSFRSRRPEVFCKKGALRYFVKFARICKNTFFRRTPLVATSGYSIAIGGHNKKKILENDKNVQKQPLEVFYRKSCSLKFCNIHMKKTELESVFNKVVPTQVFSSKYCNIFINTYFEEHLRTAASECRLQQQ